MKKPICTECGLCCMPLGDQNAFCDLTEQELGKLSYKFKAKNVVYLPLIDQLFGRCPPAALKTAFRRMLAGPFKGREMLVCCQLRGSLLHRVKCGIYENRPSVCRTAVVPGDKSCNWLREQIGKVAR